MEAREIECIRDLRRHSEHEATSGPPAGTVLPSVRQSSCSIRRNAGGWVATTATMEIGKHHELSYGDSCVTVCDLSTDVMAALFVTFRVDGRRLSSSAICCYNVAVGRECENEI